MSERSCHAGPFQDLNRFLGVLGVPLRERGGQWVAGAATINAGAELLARVGNTWVSGTVVSASVRCLGVVVQGDDGATTIGLHQDTLVIMGRGEKAEFLALFENFLWAAMTAAGLLELHSFVDWEPELRAATEDEVGYRAEAVSCLVHRVLRQP